VALAFRSNIITQVDKISSFLGIIILIIPFMLWNISTFKRKSKKLLFGASIILIVLSTIFTTQFFNIQKQIQEIEKK